MQLTLKGLSLALALSLAVVAGARAETIALKADLKAPNEVPPNSSAGTGSLTATYDTETRKLSWTLNYQDLTGPVVAAHFHGPADPSKNSGIVVPFRVAPSPITGFATITESEAADMLAGKWYANIHTAAHPGGEIRGQLVK
jgi:hypothetical protein